MPGVLNEKKTGWQEKQEGKKKARQVDKRKKIEENGRKMKPTSFSVQNKKIILKMTPML